MEHREWVSSYVISPIVYAIGYSCSADVGANSVWSLCLPLCGLTKLSKRCLHSVCLSVIIHQFVVGRSIMSNCCHLGLSVFVFWNSKQASFLSLLYWPSVNCLVVHLLVCQACCAFSLMPSSSLSWSTSVKSLLVNFWVTLWQLLPPDPIAVPCSYPLDCKFQNPQSPQMPRYHGQTGVRAVSAHHSCWKLWPHTWKHYVLNCLVIVSLSRTVSASLHSPLLHHSQPTWK